MTPYPPRLAAAVRHALIGLAALASPALAAEAADEKQSGSPRTLDTLHVTGVTEELGKIATPYNIVSREDILKGGAATLGLALDHLSGVRADTFGAGASRPIIRGQTAPRVKVLSDSSNIIDASDVSPDHAITVDPLLSTRIEVLRGPATLRFGGGAIGGVVNVLDDKIPTALPSDGTEGQVVIRGNSVAKEKAFGAAISTQLGNHWVLHAEGSSVDRGNYRAPGQQSSRVANTFAKSENGSVGLSWVTDTGYFGVAYSYRKDQYGLPGHNHEYESCHPHGSKLHCGGHGHADDEHEHGEKADDVAWIDLSSKRVDLRAEFADPLPGIAHIRFRANHTDYKHDELEGSKVETTFSNKGYDSRLEIEHVPLAGWSGVFGVQHSDTQFATRGSEAFLPTVDTVNTGLFLVEHFQLNDQWHFELGGRREWLKHTPKQDARGRPVFKDTASAYSGSAIWNFAPDLSLTFIAARSQRLPHAQELYARGLHMATNTYECGLVPHPLTCGGLANNAPYGKETSRNYELLLRKTAGDLDFSVGAFLNEVDNYIYARTLDQHEDFRLIKYSQADVEFRGLETELNYRLTDALTVGAFADMVRARFKDGSGNLPRIPASRLGARTRYERGPFSGEAEFYRVNPQRHIAAYEKPTPGYNMLNLSFDYALQEGRTRLFLRGDNLLNEKVWNHASFLATTVPLPGRSVSAGLRYTF
ncbi:MAG TPA: TonB-dependent receptor [Stenotrophomonas sp.]|nr:TonB-dependent receptor [Stenotrophomonas sp.]